MMSNYQNEEVTTSLNPNPEKNCYTIGELMVMLDISRNTAMKLLKQKEFFWLRLGNTYRIPKDSFENWLNSGTAER